MQFIVTIIETQTNLYGKIFRKHMNKLTLFPIVCTANIVRGGSLIELVINLSRCHTRINSKLRLKINLLKCNYFITVTYYYVVEICIAKLYITVY